MGLARLVQASTTTGMLVAQEMVKPNQLVFTPRLGPLFRINGFGRNHNAVGKSPYTMSQPLVPGR
jgi:hypothetical protein